MSMCTEAVTDIEIEKKNDRLGLQGRKKTQPHCEEGCVFIHFPPCILCAVVSKLLSRDNSSPDFFLVHVLLMGVSVS